MMIMMTTMMKMTMMMMIMMMTNKRIEILAELSRARSGASWVRKCAKLPIGENLVNK